MSATFAAIIGLTILAISELATPYQGAVVVSDEGFRFLIGSMNVDRANAATVPPKDLVHRLVLDNGTVIE